MSCSICCETYNRKQYLHKTCRYCQFECCQICIQTYLLGSAQDPHCMNCRKGWDTEHLESMVSKTFRFKDYKNHRESVLFDLEKSLLPQTQPMVQITLELRHLQTVHKDLTQQLNRYQKQNRDIADQIFAEKRHQRCRRRLLTEAENKEIERTLQHLNEERSSIYPQINELHQIMYENVVQQRELKRQLNGSGAAVNKAKPVFTLRCSKENCKGFIAGNPWRCGVCQSYACSKCHEFIGESNDSNHKCQPDNIETAKLLRKEAKSCPGCSTLIYRISGCAQMWCTQCHTAFNWNTGAIETGVVHNPHFYEYQRQNTNHTVRNVQDVQCGGLVTIREIMRLLQGCRNDEIYSTIYRLHRLLAHIQQIELPRYHIQFFVNTNLPLRIEYLMNELTEEEFKKRLQIKEKQNHKKRDIYLILDMYVQTLNDLFRNLVNEPWSHKLPEEQNQLFEDWLKQVQQLMEYGNEHFEKISKRYNCVVPHLNTERFYTVKN